MSQYPLYRPHKFDYKKRRENLCKLLPYNQCIIVLKSLPVQFMSNDTDYLYRQHTDMVYFSGFPEPESALIITKDCDRVTAKLYVREKCEANEIWTGKYFGTQGTKELFDVDGEDINNLDTDINNYDSIICHYDDSDIILFIQQLRLVKDVDEINLMRKSCEISGNAHINAMRHSVNLFKQNGSVPEIEIDAILTYEITRAGCRRLAYPNVVAGGVNATCLHYDSYEDTVKEGDLVLVDSGGEYKYYASDITRTWPINGKYTKVQREIYDIVLKANKECIDIARPGTTIQVIHDHAKEVIRKGLSDIGIVNDVNDVDKFFMHNVGHWIGIDVHDCRETDRWNVILKPGHCFTIEPGIYINDKVGASEYHGIGIRIEDDIVITSDGCEVLSSFVPKELNDIEELLNDLTKIN